MPTFNENLYAALKPLIPEALIWMDQNGPRPALPYCAMKIMSVRRKNYDHHSDVDANGFQTVTGDREFTLNIQRYQAYTSEDVTTALQSVSDKMQLQSSIDRFLNKGFATFDVHPVMDISALLDSTQIEKRATLDVMIRYRSTQLDNVGLIETVNMTGNDDSPNSPEYVIVASVN